MQDNIVEGKVERDNLIKININEMVVKGLLTIRGTI